MTVATALGLDDSVSQWVVELPARSRVFEKNGIDYCCGGKATLRQACQKRQINPDAVIADLLAAGHDPDQRDWSAASLTELADHIESTHHAWLKKELPRVAMLVHRTFTVHGLHYRWLAELKTTYDRFAAEMDAHMFKEEHILFPRIRQIDAGRREAEVDQPVAIMEHEHERAGADLETMRTITSNYSAPPEACNTFRAMLDALREIEADTHLHVHKENNILFPRAMAAAG
jgi:regulator of cell morphogenesis and NO signaling